MVLLSKLPGLAGEFSLCRGCLGPVGQGAEAGLGLHPIFLIMAVNAAMLHEEVVRVVADIVLGGLRRGGGELSGVISRMGIHIF